MDMMSPIVIHIHIWWTNITLIQSGLHFSWILSDIVAFQVPPTIVKKIFAQTFSYINVQLFNRCFVAQLCFGCDFHGLISIINIPFQLSSSFLQSSSIPGLLYFQQREICESRFSRVGTMVSSGKRKGNYLIGLIYDYACMPNLFIETNVIFLRFQITYETYI